VNALLALLLAGGSALALGESADIELIRPVYAPYSLPGIDTPVVREFGHLRLGTFSQYTRDPLVLYTDGLDQGAVIAQRLSTSLGGSLDLGEKAALRFSLPLAGQWGSENPDDTGSTLGIGDASLGFRLGFYQTDRLKLGARADASLPIGTRRSWLGEDRPRLFLGGLVLVSLGKIDILADVGLVARTAVDTQRDFTLANEMTANVGGRLWVSPDQLALGAAFLSRTGLAAPFQSGAETSTEFLTTMQWDPEGPLQWETGVGKGLAQGYGTSEFRAFVAATYVRTKPQPIAAPPAITITEAPEPIDIEELAEQPWEPEELARIEEKRIIIRDPIKFEYNTARLLPESIPTLRYVAQLMNGDWRIGHVVIEGHASEEGSFEYNYELSALRARSIWEELQRASVHPDRLSYRGMGEVLPHSGGDDEASLASNRRVEFHVVRQYAPSEDDPNYRPVEQAPWDGESVDLQAPVREQDASDDTLIDAEQFIEDDPIEDDPIDDALFDDPDESPAETGSEEIPR
jgi:outer membrane protein OmpA-like peptidoglycan-associated protein